MHNYDITFIELLGKSSFLQSDIFKKEGMPTGFIVSLPLTKRQLHWLL